LAREFDLPVSSYTDVETSVSNVAVYSQKRPDWSSARRAQLEAGLERIKNCGLKISPAKLSLTQLRNQDWAESWKRHFKPIEIGSALLIKPGWSRRQPRKGQKVMVLDPGLSVGTGHHPTTAFCLQQLVARRDPGRQQSFLDIGAGSGIVAIAAVRLGYCPV